MGVVGRVRYVLLSDALIENMPDKQIEAVFGHEAGHVKHHHIVFLVLSALACGLLVLLLGNGIIIGLERLWPEQSAFNQYSQWMGEAAIVPLAVVWVLVFGWISRRFERQADVHGAQSVAAQGTEPAETPERGAGSGRLDMYGTQVMAAALVRVALLNGIPTEARSWRHSSIGSRARFLQYLATSDNALARFSRRLRVLKAVILVIVVLALAGLVWTYLPHVSKG